MKEKFFVTLAIIMAVLSPFVPLFPGEVQAAFVALTVPVIFFFHKENLEWCRKLDRIMAGEKGVKL